jgi:hypothetical protein
MLSRRSPVSVSEPEQEQVTNSDSQLPQPKENQ